MSESSNRNDQTVPTIKERLIERLKRAKEKAPSDWKKALADHDPYFDSYGGSKCMDAAANAISNGRRANIDRIARVTIALEEIVGIEPTPII
ncbi:hypothetical protein [Salmonirosea aquatica]|uniref:Uncharacterized protein n=1 Tax=Salmonirosea aquatica TaxID=2654236 RepID=A0A7C9BFL7_9BACT|nr:hypothetical protein [Cytophagaceae bacterium SJW1-29]